MCRVTIGHLRVTIGHLRLRVTMGHPKVRQTCEELKSFIIDSVCVCMHLKGSSWTSDSPVSELGSDRCMSTSTASVENIGERPRDEACDVSWRGWVKGLHIL